MKIKLIATALALFTGQALFAQQDYVIYFDNDSTAIALNQPVTIQTKKGPVKVVLKQKEVLTHTDAFYSFQYPSHYSVTPAKVDAGIEQVLVLLAKGNGMLIQKYTSNNPELIRDFMLDEITKESKAAGYAETKTDVEKKLADGRVVKGVQSKLVFEDEVNVYAVYPVKIKSGGIIIVQMVTTPDEKDDMHFLNTFWSTLKVHEQAVDSEK